tara:strand:+ start:487 stop:3147 length:2661 start_codon:yes stop_codon:yes gene_type:complete
MAVYTNDLRLKEIATGDEAGTWGNSTNTNLQLIADAFGFGTEAITTNADTHTTTIADGSADAGRAIYLKYTGTLDSACTITIGPNTVSKLWFIENATSGSQNIIISQGSGANITIPAGDTKAIYSDGAGSGAAMVDAFASLNVVDLKVEDDLTVTDDLIVNGDIDLEGSIDVNGTANLDVVDIDGAVDMASTLQVDGAITSDAGAIISVTDNSDVLTLRSTDADANAGPILNLNRNSASPADNDYIGEIKFDGRNDAAQAVTYAGFAGRILDASDGTEDGRFELYTIRAGAQNSMMVTTASEIVFNNDSIDLDFRVESNSKSHMLFVDGGEDLVLIGTGTKSVVSGGDPGLQVSGNGFDSMIGLTRHDTNAFAAQIMLAKSRNATVGSNTIVQDGDGIGAIGFFADDGTNLDSQVAYITAEIDGTPGANDTPGRLIFSTTADGAAAVTERMRIDSSGEVTMTRADNGVNLTLECTDTDANAGPNLKLNRAVTGASDDEIGNVIFHGRDNAGNGEDYGLIAGFISDATNGSEDGRLNFKVLMNGTSRDYLILNGGGSVVVNQDAQDVDFRVESDTNANAFFIDASENTIGMGRVPSSAQLDIEGGSNGTLTGLRIRNSGQVAASAIKQVFSLNRDGSDIDFEAAAITVSKDQNWTTTASTVDATMAINVILNETVENRMNIGGLTGVQIPFINDSYNFRVYAQDADSFFGIRDTSNNSVFLQIDRSDGLTVFTFDGHTGNLVINGSISKGSGSFKIDHPLPAKKETHHLVHSFVEAPQADNIYRGSVDLVDGSATVNLDTAARMTEGTFVLLNTNLQCFTSNESGWTAIKGSISGNTLTITAQDNTCTDTISWIVVGERQDEHMKETDWTDSDGRVIVEPEKITEGE